MLRNTRGLSRPYRLSNLVGARRFKLNDSDIKGEDRKITKDDSKPKETSEFKVILNAELETTNKSDGVSLASAVQGGISLDNSSSASSNSSNTSSHPHTPLPSLMPMPKIPLHIQQTLEKINQMTHKELVTQKFLDGDRRPFLSTKADGFLLRKNLIRDLPNLIDLFLEAGAESESGPKNNAGLYPDDSLEDINKIYSDLSKLDRDEAVYKKYFEKYGIKQDLSNELIQGFNGIADKFQLIRRGETFQLPLSPNQFRFEANIFNMPYNVPGFDVSFSGIPLRFGQQRHKSKDLPVELVKDLRMFEKSVPIRKTDLDFATDSELKEQDEDKSITVHPEVDTVGLVEKVKLMERDCIEISHSLDHYRPFPIPSTSNTQHPNYSSIALLEFLITSVQRSLVKEIEEYLGGMYRSPDMIFKPNLYYLFEKRKPKILSMWNENGATEISLPIKLAKLSSFPLSVYNIKTRKEKRFLRLHLFKIYMINLEGLIDRLTTMKYQTEALKNNFLKRLVDRIYKEIDSELINQVIKDLSIPSKKLEEFSIGKDVGVLMYKPFENSSFKRIIWTKNGWGV